MPIEYIGVDEAISRGGLENATSGGWIDRPNGCASRSSLPCNNTELLRPAADPSVVLRGAVENDSIALPKPSFSRYHSFSRSVRRCDSH